MGFFRRAVAVTWPSLSWPELANTDPRVWVSGPAMSTASGETVTTGAALSISAVWNAVWLLATCVGMLPLHMYERQVDGGRRTAREHQLYALLHSRPNRRMSSYAFRELMHAWVELRGNAYAEILPGPRGAIDQLKPLYPDYVTIDGQENGDVVYRIQEPGKAERVLLWDEVFHVMGHSLDGYCGLSTVAFARESLGSTMAQERYGAKLFANGVQPSGVLEHPEKLSGDAANRIGAEFSAKHAGRDNWGKVVVLEEGMKFNPLTMTNEDAQFLMSRQFQIREIARWFMLQPHKIGDLEDATFSNIEEQNIEFVVFSLTSRLVRWEQAIGLQLVDERELERFYAKFVVDGLLRGNTLARFMAYAIGRQWGFLNANEVREMEERNPYEGGDEYLRAQNMAVVGEDVLPGGAGPGGGFGGMAAMLAQMQVMQAAGIGGNGHGS